jgi:hypothetical protein
VLTGFQDQLTIFGQAVTGQYFQPLPNVIGQRGGVFYIETKLDRGGSFIDMLSTGTRGADELLFELGLRNVDSLRDFKCHADRRRFLPNRLVM